MHLAITTIYYDQYCPPSEQHRLICLVFYITMPMPYRQKRDRATGIVFTGHGTCWPCQSPKMQTRGGET